MLEYFVLHRVESLLYNPPEEKMYQQISIQSLMYMLWFNVYM